MDGNTYLFSCYVVCSSFDFAKSSLANVFTNHVVTDATTLLDWFLPISRIGGHVVRRLARRLRPCPNFNLVLPSLF